MRNDSFETNGAVRQFVNGAVRQVARIIATVVIVLSIGACEPVGLRTLAAPQSGPPILCPAALVLPFRLVIDRSRSNPVWGRWAADGSRLDIVWPAGFRLDDGPDPALIDAAGGIVGRDGDLIDDAGGSGGNPITICGLGDVDYPLGSSRQ